MICRKCKQEVPDGAYCLLCGTKQAVSPRASRTRINGTGTVFRRGKTWTAQVTKYAYVTEENGVQRKIRRYSTKGGFTTKRDAVLYLESLRQGQQRKVPTLLDLWQQYEKNDLPKLGKSKQYGYKKARERMESIIGRKIDTMTTADLQAVVDDNAETYYQAKYMKTILSKMYAKAMADQFVTVNLSEFITLPELEEKEAEPFKADEVAKLWDSFNGGNDFVGYLLLMIYSGMMPGELFACKKSMIDTNKCEIWGCGKKTETRKKEVPIVFAECVIPVIDVLCDMYDGDMLYPYKKDVWYKEYHKVVQGIDGVRDLPPYSCRHTTGTEAAKQGLNASTIQKVMRHKKITTSQRYIHLGDDEAHSGINKIG